MDTNAGAASQSESALSAENISAYSTEIDTDALQAFKTRDASSYDAVTDEFDRFTESLTSPLALQMVSLADLTSSQRVLDIGTGTGIVALQAAAKVSPTGRILGIDLSDGMLAKATQKSSQMGLADRVEFRKMDAENLKVQDGSFDAVLSLFALLHFPNPQVALGEMFRALRPGGTLVVAVGSGPPMLSLKGLFHYIESVPEKVAQFQGRRLTAPGFLNRLVDKYLPDSSAAEETHLAREGLGKPGHILRMVCEAGFEKAYSHWEGHQAILDTPEEFWDIQRTFSSKARKRLSDASAERVAKLREEFLHACKVVQSRGGKLVYPVAAFYVIARRPSK